MTENEREAYEQLRQKSTSGSVGKREDRYIRIKYSRYKKSIKALIATTIIAVSAIIGGGKAVVDTAKDMITITQLEADFKTDVVNPKTHRTENHQNYYYDYANLADYIENMEDFDEGVYYLLLTIGEHQTNQVLEHTKYKSIESFLEAKGYKNVDEFKKSMKKKVLLEDEIERKERELKEMQEEHLDTTTEEYKAGGK